MSEQASRAPAPGLPLPPLLSRAALLVALDRNDDAEVELRALHGSVAKSERGGIVTLASELGLPKRSVRSAALT